MLPFEKNYKYVCMPTSPPPAPYTDPKNLIAFVPSGAGTQDWGQGEMGEAGSLLYNLLLL